MVLRTVSRLSVLFEVFELKSIFVADPDTEQRDNLIRYLVLNEFDAKGFGTVSELNDQLAHSTPDMLLLEVDFLDGDGFTVLKKVRSRYTFPCLFVTSRTSESDRILAFELGADDYIMKPCSLKELVLRIRTIFRHVYHESSHDSGIKSWSIATDVLSYDESSRYFYLNGNPISFTVSEHKLMDLFVKNPGVLFSRTDLLVRCFGYESESYERIIDTHIKNIRNKLGPFGSEWIETVRGYGYRFGG